LDTDEPGEMKEPGGAGTTPLQGAGHGSASASGRLTVTPNFPQGSINAAAVDSGPALLDPITSGEYARIEGRILSLMVKDQPDRPFPDLPRIPHTC
jgi:hypothetical protein